ncbi:23S rRNA methyltransferase [Gammaproteobacteria bacterium SCGC AG-212-F23]|nr:23S rRNA methyltransferase [Gammaproteobacteria bacterium SCGC AG-212-F23]
MHSTVIFGLHTVEALLKKNPKRITALYFLQDREDKRIQAILELAKSFSIKTYVKPRQALDQMTQNGVHQGIVVECAPLKNANEQDLEQLIEELTEPPLLLLLDGVQDPHNLGACLRTADAAGVHAVITPRDKSASITPTVSKVASGAAETLPLIQVTNLVRTIELLKEKNIWIYGAAGEAENTLYQGNFKSATAIVLGAEGTGLRRLTREHCDALFHIPMLGSVSSLNVSVATGVFLFEVVRQRVRHPELRA